MTNVIERLAGFPGKPEAEIGFGNDWYVSQYHKNDYSAGIYGPTRKTEQAAIRAWNAMVQRIRKANAGGLIDD